mmetsp:Transcript_12712/g.25807  ORF Transcript_12712/g.25807 Transcript_12712/m.25807 type:complete len:204 (+) Transcript_12712:643-1254(+)
MKPFLTQVKIPPRVSIVSLLGSREMCPLREIRNRRPASQHTFAKSFNDWIRLSWTSFEREIYGCDKMQLPHGSHDNSHPLAGTKTSTEFFIVHCAQQTHVLQSACTLKCSAAVQGSLRYPHGPIRVRNSVRYEHSTTPSDSFVPGSCTSRPLRHGHRSLDPLLRNHRGSPTPGDPLEILHRGHAASLSPLHSATDKGSRNVQH